MKETLRISMQFFADEPAPQDTNNEPAPQDTEPKADNEPAKTFTQEQVNKLISERLDRQQKKFEAEKEEAAKLAKMNAEQKAAYAAKKREDELTAREKAVQTKELRYTALGILEEKKLPTQLIDCLNLESADSCDKSIKAVSKAFSEAVSAAVDARLKSNIPPAYSGGNKNKDPFLAGLGI